MLPEIWQTAGEEITLLHSSALRKKKTVYEVQTLWNFFLVFLRCEKATVFGLARNTMWGNYWRVQSCFH